MWKKQELKTKGTKRREIKSQTIELRTFYYLSNRPILIQETHPAVWCTCLAQSLTWNENDHINMPNCDGPNL